MNPIRGAINDVKRTYKDADVFLNKKRGLKTERDDSNIIGVLFILVIIGIGISHYFGLY